MKTHHGSHGYPLLHSWSLVLGTTMAMCLASAAPAGDVSATWIGPPDGLWSVGKNWTNGIAPDNTGSTFYNVFIGQDIKDPATVTLDFSAEIQNLTMAAGSSLLVMPDLKLLIVGSTFWNDGSFILDSGGSTADLRLGSNVMCDGTGFIGTSEFSGNRLRGNDTSIRLTNSAGHSIRGWMELGKGSLQLTNHGLVQADLGLGIDVDLTAGGDHINDGIMRSLNGASLNFLPSANLTNEGGVIEAGAGSHVTFNSNHITGGTIRCVDWHGPGSVSLLGTATLESVTVEGPLAVGDGMVLRLRNAMQLNGTLKVMSDGANTDLVLASDPFILQGSCAEVKFSNLLANRVLGSTSSHRLVVSSTATLRGSFQLGCNSMQLTNDGDIEFDSSSGGVVDLGGSSTNYNSGTIRATHGATMSISDSLFYNGGGVIEAGSNSQALLMGTTVIGGVVRASTTCGGGVAGKGGGGPIGDVHAQDVTTLQDLAVEGQLEVDDGATLRLLGDIDFQGPLHVSGDLLPTIVALDAAGFTLSGPGETVLSNSMNNRVYAEDADAIVVNAGDHTIRGAGHIGEDSMSLVNNGCILVDQPAGMQFDVSDDGFFFNAGSLRMANGSATIGPGVFENSGDVAIEVKRTLDRIGDYVQTNGSTTVDGTLSATGGVVIHGGTLAGSGLVQALVVNDGGSVAPGNSPGILSVEQDYTQGAEAEFAVEIGGSAEGQYDRLAVGGAAMLAGTLMLERADGYGPPAGQEFVILTSEGLRFGEFDTVDTCDQVTVEYFDHGVVVRYDQDLTMPADLNHDGIVDGADLGALLGSWGPCPGVCCAADLNHDGMVDGADLGALLGAWTL